MPPPKSRRALAAIVTQPGVNSQETYQKGLERYLHGDQDNARKFWQQALQQDPQNQNAVNSLNRIQPPQNSALNPQQQMIYNQGLNAFMSNDPFTAAQAFTNVLSQNHGHLESQRALERAKAAIANRQFSQTGRTLAGEGSGYR